MVVLFYFSNKDQPNVNKAWESEEQMLEVRMVFGFRPQCCPDPSSHDQTSNPDCCSLSWEVF